MSRTDKKTVFLLILLIIAGIAVCDAQPSRTRGRNPERALFGKARKVKVRETRIREPKAVRKAKKKQERNEKKLKKEYEKFVEDSKKRAFNIQTPDVQARMKEDKKKITLRDRQKKKREAAATRRAERKYKK